MRAQAAGRHHVGAVMGRGRILLLAKAPDPGMVKTRLIPALGTDGAAELQARLIRHALDRILRPQMPETELWCTPDAGHTFFRELAGRHSVCLRDQTGGDLGERMLFAVRDGLSRADYVILMGTDSPELTPGRIRLAAELLASGLDAVLGPAEDGGYVLLGLSRLREGLFRDMSWGTDRVLEETRRRLAGCNFFWEELPSCGDLDRPEDLRRLQGSQDPSIRNLLWDLYQ